VNELTHCNGARVLAQRYFI